MRDCPNCSQPIQDEAVFCRHCHTELEPPLWLTSMRRCPYCAEWIENDLEQCRFCTRNLLAAGAQHAAPFVESSSTPEDITQSLRDSLLDDESGEAAAIAADERQRCWCCAEDARSGGIANWIGLPEVAQGI